MDALAIASSNNNKVSLCPNMIVKNESHVILRLLNSVAPIIDYWVIADTGSTDGTQEIIKNYYNIEKMLGSGLKLHCLELEFYNPNLIKSLIKTRTSSDLIMAFMI